MVPTKTPWIAALSAFSGPQDRQRNAPVPKSTHKHAPEEYMSLLCHRFPTTPLSGASVSMPTLTDIQAPILTTRGSSTPFRVYVPDSPAPPSSKRK